MLTLPYNVSPLTIVTKLLSIYRRFAIFKPLVFSQAIVARTRDGRIASGASISKAHSTIYIRKREAVNSLLEEISHTKREKKEGNEKVKSASSQVVQTTSAYPDFCSIKRPRLFLPPTRWDDGPSTGYLSPLPQYYFVVTHLYSWAHLRLSGILCNCSLCPRRFVHAGIVLALFFYPPSADLSITASKENF